MHKETTSVYISTGMRQGSCVLWVCSLTLIHTSWAPFVQECPPSESDGGQGLCEPGAMWLPWFYKRICEACKTWSYPSGYCLAIIVVWIPFVCINIHKAELCPFYFFENRNCCTWEMMENVYSLYNLPAVDWDQWHFPEKINYPKFAAHSYSISSQQMLISMLLLIGIHFRFCLKWR